MAPIGAPAVNPAGKLAIFVINVVPFHAIALFKPK
jgi:hypothetical protein